MNDYNAGESSHADYIHNYHHIQVYSVQYYIMEFPPMPIVPIRHTFPILHHLVENVKYE